MTNKERLYDTLGELLYAVTKADGIIHKEQLTALEEIIKDHPWASNIKWSFNYELEHNHTVNDVYDKVISFCHGYGPTAEYEEFIDLMNKIAIANGVVDQREEKLIKSFTEDLTERFRADIEKLMN